MLNIKQTVNTLPVLGTSNTCASLHTIRAFQQYGAPLMKPNMARGSVTLRAATAESNGSSAANDGCEQDVVVKIDNQSDAFSTIVTIEFGDLLGEMLDTVASLKTLGLNIRRAQLGKNSCGGNVHTFYVTDAKTSEKVIKSAKIEEIRLTILNTMLQFHPEAGESLGWGSDAARNARSSGGDPMTSPLGGRTGAPITQIEVRDHPTGVFSQILVNTLDRPGLLVDIVHILKDINLNVISAEVDTIGRNAVDTFNVTYHGEPLNSSMQQLATNTLQYYLSQSEVEKEYSESY